MIIENIKTGQRFEVAPETNFPKTAYKIVQSAPDSTSEPVTPEIVLPPVVVKKPAKKPAKKKTAKKKTKK